MKIQTLAHMVDIRLIDGAPVLIVVENGGVELYAILAPAMLGWLSWRIGKAQDILKGESDGKSEPAASGPGVESGSGN